MKRKIGIALLMLLGLAFCGFPKSADKQALATEISIPAVKVKSGESADVPIKLDAADNLAGIKLVVKYDAELLTFKKADKSKETSPLMHIINDKKPGSLIIVMAGAKGISGKNFTMAVMTFETKKDLKESKTVKIEITESQLMNEQLKDIAHKIKAEPLTITPQK